MKILTTEGKGQKFRILIQVADTPRNSTASRSITIDMEKEMSIEEVRVWLIGQLKKEVV